MHDALAAAIRSFADNVKANVSANAAGEPEAQLSGPVKALIEAIGAVIHRKVVAKAESATRDRLGIPDFGVVVDNALCGYVELKELGNGADTSRYKGRDKAQWERFKAQPNIIYTDGNEWCLYQNGEPVGRLLRFSKDIIKHGGKGVADGDVELFHSLVTRMIAWHPIVPKDPKEQAALLAPLCRLLREDVAEALGDPASPLNALAKNWRQLLFPDADDNRFADSYAQTVTFALLLARSESADVSDIYKAIAKLEAGHTLLSRALQVLTDAKVRAEIGASLQVLQRVIQAFPPGEMKRDAAKRGGGEDPWLYFYEYFLSAYDPELRRNSGVYYTPVQVVKCQVSLVDELLRHRLGRSGGFAHKDVITLDPAVGTGTYLLGVVDNALDAVKVAQGGGAVAGKATALAANIFGFELMTGPYAVSELRLTRALKDRGATLPKDGVGIYLADTLESPFGIPPELPQFFQPIAEQHARALRVKNKERVIVCLGNPPYDRHEAVQYTGDEVTAADRARTGGWIRWGDPGTERRLKECPRYPRLEDFIEPAKLAGHGGDLKNLYNLYVYFWRWAIWKVFEHTSGKQEANPGIVSFITASSYIRGDAFVGMREMLRRLCHEIWIIDLGGEGRGTRQDDNVFNIQTPVAICIALREGKKDKGVPAKVRYTSILGTREEKYAKLAAVKSFRSLKWKTCPSDWHAPLRPAGTGAYFKWPLLTDLMPWQQSGQEIKRSWPIGPDEDTLRRRWKRLLRDWKGSGRAEAFKETRDRKVTGTYPTLVEGEEVGTPIADIPVGAEMPRVQRVAFRSFDRQYVIADNRVGDYFRPALWRAHRSGKQVYLATLTTEPFSGGAAVVAASDMPDRHYFNGRGGKDIFPLYRDAGAAVPNILPGLLELWGGKLKREITPESFAAYVYGITGHSGFVSKFWDELEDCELRIPLTLDRHLFCDVYAAGAMLLNLHTFGERFEPPGTRSPRTPVGSAKVKVAISEVPSDYPEKFVYIEESRTLRIGTGEIVNVDRAVWGYEVSGLQVVKSWLGYRMKDRKGKKSSPLDATHPERWTSEFTEELLRLLWILEHSLTMEPDLAALLEAVCAGPLMGARDLPVVPVAMRKPPRAVEAGGLFEGSDEEGKGGDEEE